MKYAVEMGSFVTIYRPDNKVRERVLAVVAVDRNLSIV
jgi:hypothetical protein